MNKDPEICKVCNGVGFVEFAKENGRFGVRLERYDCPTCGGTGNETKTSVNSHNEDMGK